MSQSSPDDRFERLYRGIITAAIYTSVWCLCFYWPQFVAYIIVPDRVVQSEIIALMIVQPLALTALGARTGLRGAGMNLLLAIIAIVGSTAFILATSRDSDNVFIRSLMISSMIAAYLLAGFLTYQKQVKR